MHIDVESRGFSLSHALRQAIEGEAQRYATRCPDDLAGLRVRLFDTNGPRGGDDKTCFIQASLRRRQRSVIAIHVDADLYHAISAAFAKLERGTRSVLDPHDAHRRHPEPYLRGIH